MNQDESQAYRVMPITAAIANLTNKFEELRSLIIDRIIEDQENKTEFDKKLARLRLPAYESDAWREITGELTIAWAAAQSIFGDRAQTEHAFQIYDRYLPIIETQLTPEEDSDDDDSDSEEDPWSDEHDYQ